MEPTIDVPLVIRGSKPKPSKFPGFLENQEVDILAREFTPNRKSLICNDGEQLRGFGLTPPTCGQQPPDTSQLSHIGTTGNLLYILQVEAGPKPDLRYRQTMNWTRIEICQDLRVVFISNEMHSGISHIVIFPD